jgi:hypothetical protein
VTNGTDVGISVAGSAVQAASRMMKIAKIAIERRIQSPEQNH